MDKKKYRSYIIYFILVFTSNFASISIILLSDKYIGYGYIFNLIYELSTFSALYIGIRNLTIAQLLADHILASTTGYFLAQKLSNYIISIYK